MTLSTQAAADAPICWPPAVSCTPARPLWRLVSAARLLAATGDILSDDVQFGRLRWPEYNTSPVPALTQESEPRTSRWLPLGTPLTAEDCLNGGRTNVRYETAADWLRASSTSLSRGWLQSHYIALNRRPHLSPRARSRDVNPSSWLRLWRRSWCLRYL